VDQTYQISRLTLLSIGKLIKGTVSTKTLGGPIMIAEMAGQQAKAGIDQPDFFHCGAEHQPGRAQFSAHSGARWRPPDVFFIEAVIRRPINVRMREIAQQAGIFILIMLMIFVFYNDITRYFPVDDFNHPLMNLNF
jgi:regulator of sigma E protease